MSRTFKVDAPHMKGDDVKEWQGDLLDRFKHWRVDYPLVADGDYGVVSRDATATVLYGLGVDRDEMIEGVTAELRIKIRNSRLNDDEMKLYKEREGWRKRLAKLHDHGGKVASPLGTILSSSWGYHPPVHDGVDLICRPNAVLYAICDGEIIRADTGGWWGKGAPSDPTVRARGDGIVVLRCSVEAGPFKPGLNFCYGHAEHPIVRPGEKVQAGDPIGKAGMANAWHTHYMVNHNPNDRGVGDRDPMPFVNYALLHS